MSRTLRFLTVATALFWAASAQALVVHFVAEDGLTGDQENPPQPSPGTGTGHAYFDTESLLLEVLVEWEGLLQPATAAHIHLAPAVGENGGIAVDFVAAGFPVGNSAGSYSQVFNLDDASGFFPSFLASFGGDVDAAREALLLGMYEGRAYFNIHSQFAPSGEIRGNITVIPEPATMALVGLGVALVAARRRLT